MTTEVNLVHHGRLAVASQGRAEKVLHHLAIVHLARVGNQAHPMDWIMDHGAQIPVESQAKVEVAKAVIVRSQASASQVSRRYSSISVLLVPIHFQFVAKIMAV